MLILMKCKTPTASQLQFSCLVRCTIQRGPAEKKEITSGPDFWRANIEGVYRKRNPAKLKSMDSLMEKYKGKELQLYVKVCKTSAALSLLALIAFIC